jgi:hypothetical protein
LLGLIIDGKSVQEINQLPSCFQWVLIDFGSRIAPHAITGLHQDGLQPLFATALAIPREDDFVETVDQSVRSLLMLQPVKGQGFATKPMDTHHPFDKHLRQVIEHSRVSQLDQRRSQGVPFRRSHLLHASGVAQARADGSLSRLLESIARTDVLLVESFYSPCTQSTLSVVQQPIL